MIRRLLRLKTAATRARSMSGNYQLMVKPLLRGAPPSLLGDISGHSSLVGDTEVVSVNNTGADTFSLDPTRCFPTPSNILSSSLLGIQLHKSQP
jgi:hypothetical protein